MTKEYMAVLRVKERSIGASFMHQLDVFINYVEDAYRRAIRTPDPIKWIRERDEKTRAKMIEYMRDPDQNLPAGKALQAALNYLHNLWGIEKETAEEPSALPRAGQSSSPAPPGCAGCARRRARPACR